MPMRLPTQFSPVLPYQLVQRGQCAAVMKMLLCAKHVTGWVSSQ